MSTDTKDDTQKALDNLTQTRVPALSARTAEEIAANREVEISHFARHQVPAECMKVVQDFNFARGNAIERIWTAGPDLETGVQNLEQAIEYLYVEIARLRAE